MGRDPVAEAEASSLTLANSLICRPRSGAIAFFVGQCWSRWFSERRPAVLPWLHALSRTRLSASTLQRVGGHFRPAGRPVLPSGRKLGLRFPAALALYRGGAMFSFGVYRFDLVPTIVVVTSLLLLVAMIWAY